MASELTTEQKEFLKECETEFRDRFTDKDEEFKRHCDRVAKPPPIFDNIMSQHHRQNNRNFHSNRGFNYQQRDQGRNQGGYNSHRNYDDRRNDSQFYQNRNYYRSHDRY